MQSVKTSRNLSSSCSLSNDSLAESNKTYKSNKSSFNATQVMFQRSILQQLTTVLPNPDLSIWPENPLQSPSLRPLDPFSNSTLPKIQLEETSEAIPLDHDNQLPDHLVKSTKPSIKEEGLPQPCLMPLTKSDL